MSFFYNLFKNKKDNGFYLVVDVGSESIGAAFVEYETNSNPIIHSTVRQTIPFQENINMDRFIVLLQDTLTKVINDKDLNILNIKPNSVIFTLASPWYKSQTKTINLIEDKEFTINEAGLNAILEKEKEIFLKNQITNNKKILNNSEEIIESCITQVKINGYEISNPINRKTTNADISIYLATSPLNIIDSFKKIVNKKWANVDCAFHSLIFSALNTVRVNFDESSYIIIDIAGEITDISLIRDNIILESISFPLGYRSFVRSLIKKLNLQIDIANSEVSLFFKDELENERKTIFEEVFNKTSHDWSILFTASIKQLSLKYPIPRYINLFTDTEFIKYFDKSIKLSSQEIFGEDQEKFRIKTITNQIGDCKDLFLCVTINMLDKLLNIENKHNKK